VHAYAYPRNILLRTGWILKAGYILTFEYVVFIEHFREMLYLQINDDKNDKKDKNDKNISYKTKLSW